MRKTLIWVLVLALGIVVGAIGNRIGSAQQPAAPNPLDVIPEAMPWNTPYGAPISAVRAQAAIQAAVAESFKRGWAEDIAVVDSGANLVAFLRMDGALIGSIAVAQHKARTAAKYRRPSKVFEEALQRGGAFNNVLSLDDVVALRGGIPLIEGGKLIGAIGCSGTAASQDEVVCMVGAATINK